jgi:hypothetical protein
MATITLAALSGTVTKTATIPDNKLPEWADAYSIPLADEAGDAYSNEEKVGLLFDKLIARLKSQIFHHRKRTYKPDISDTIS